MDLSMPNNQFKQLIKAALIEVLTERQDLFVEIMREAMEDFALGRAIQEGRTSTPVSREEVFKIFSQSD